MISLLSFWDNVITASVTWKDQYCPSACSSYTGTDQSWGMPLMVNIWAVCRTWWWGCLWNCPFQTRTQNVLNQNLLRMTPSLARPSSTGVRLKGRIMPWWKDLCNKQLAPHFFGANLAAAPVWVVPRDISPAEVIGQDVKEVGLRSKTRIDLKQ